LPIESLNLYSIAFTFVKSPFAKDVKGAFEIAIVQKNKKLVFENTQIPIRKSIPKKYFSKKGI